MSMTRAPTLGIAASGIDEGFAEAGVEALGEVAGQFEVLPLVVADGHAVGLVQQDVGRHQNRVGEQPTRAAPSPPLRGLVLELRHTPQLAHAGDALEQPRQPRVLGHLALQEDRRDVGVDARRPGASWPSRGCRWRNSAGSWSPMVIAWRSTTQ